MLTICFSGHRPNKLFSYDWNTEGNKKLMKKLKETILQTLSEEWNNPSYTDEYKRVTFICGGALGVDQMAFEVCLDIRNTYEGEYNLILAMPFEKQDNNWFNVVDRERLAYHKKEADKVVLVDKIDRYKIKGYVEGEYYPAKMQKRNEWMIDNSDMVIAVWDGSRGGTGNAVSYAKKLDRKIIQINPKEIL